MIYTSLILHAARWDRLYSAFDQRRLAHAYLFHGPSGSGKEGHAIELAALVNCRNPGPEGACGRCPSCIKVQGMQHPNIQIVMPLPRHNPVTKGDPPLKALRSADIDNLTTQLQAKARDPYRKIHLEGAQSILINSVRELRRTTHLKLTEPGWRAILIFQAEKLCDPNPAAANALLKLLEEPPAQTLFILVTDRPHLLLDTIRSRCQGIYFPQLTIDQATTYLGDHQGLDEVEARVLAQAVGGDLPKAQQLAAGDGDPLRAVESLIEALLLPKPNNWQRLVNDLAQLRRHQGVAFTYRLHLFQLWLRDLMLLQKTGDETRVAFSGQLPRLREHLGRFPDARWDEAAASVEQALALMGRNIQPTLVLTNLFLDVREAIKGKAVREFRVSSF